MARKKKRSRSAQQKPARGAISDASGKTGRRERRQPEPPRISGRWLLSALALTLLAAVFCAWGTLCLLFWQGSWQLLYHPVAAIARTPANAGMAFDPVAFASTDTGVPRLTGWWIPAAGGSAFNRYTVLFLHGQDGNLGDTVDALAQLHRAGVNVLAFDYRGYGQSQFEQPSEVRWRQDADWALRYLIETRHIDPATIVLDGVGLGANLALETAAAHPELAGVILELPLENPMTVVLHDARARFVPARLLVRDRYDLRAPAAALRVPLLWFAWNAHPETPASPGEPDAYRQAGARKMLVWLGPAPVASLQFSNALSRWLDQLGAPPPGSPLTGLRRWGGS